MAGRVSVSSLGASHPEPPANPDTTNASTTTNPKISAKFQPLDWLMFRGSYNTSFRVPAFNQVFNGITESPYSGSDLADPVRCPGGVPTSAFGLA